MIEKAHHHSRPSPKILALLLFLPVCSLTAQTAEELDRMLETEQVSAARAARFVLGAAELLPGHLSGAAAEDAAWEAARGKGWLRGRGDDTLRLKDAALLVMGAFELRGGIMYSIFHNPRYAYRELVYRKFIQGRADPDHPVSGPRLLQIIGTALNYSGRTAELDAALQARRQGPLGEADR